MTTDPTKVTQEEIERYRSQLAGDSKALKDMEVIERCEGDLQQAARVLESRAKIEKVRQGSNWQIAVQKAREIVCDQKFKTGLVPGLLGGLIGVFTASGSPILAAVATPVAIYITQVSLDTFCEPSKSASENDENPS